MSPRTCTDCGGPRSRQAVRCRGCAQRHRWATNGANDPRIAHLKRYHGGRTTERPYEDREWFRVRYEDRDMCLRAIADDAKAALRTIARWRVIHQIPVRREWQRTPLPSGAAHPRWSGKQICPDCDGPKTHKAARCMPCAAAHQARNGIADVMVIVRQWAYDHWRPVVFARDSYQCQRCGDDRGGNLNAHHIEHFSAIVRRLRQELSPDLTTPAGRYAFTRALIEHSDVTNTDNGVTLCDRCHWAVHEEEGWKYHRPRSSSADPGLKQTS
jgi:5-methylcytosine-specific restriction endonuclease McrA